MAESKKKLRDQVSALVYLLQCLGFTINKEKTVLKPTQSLVFLGFTVDMTKMSTPTNSKRSERKLENFWGQSLFQLDQ